jgi:anti-sigma regulatory factor (Ser/Thr protein kinase)
VSIFGAERRKWCQAYPATPDAVPRARQELARLAADAGAPVEQIEAVRLAASEAITNVVLHAYDGVTGEVRVGMDVSPSELSVLISDDGAGLRPRLEKRGLGLGLALIAQACDELDIIKRASGGTELRMRFGLDGGPGPRRDGHPGRGRDGDAGPGRNGS